LTSSLQHAPPDSPLGAQEPRVLWTPPYVSSSGDEAIALAASAGLHLDEWQSNVLLHALGERENGSWSSFEVGVAVARQNGKGGVLEARELAGLFLLGERLIVHTAHQFDTSLEAFRRLLFLIEDSPHLLRRVKRISRAHGEEGIELKTGQRIRFRTRTKGGGRGFSGDLVILDEAMILPEATVGALMPTLSARPNPQLWYLGSAVDQNVHEHGTAFTRIRARGHEGKDPRMMWAEWSLDRDHPDEVTAADAVNPEAWAEANPSLGIRITGEHVASEQRSMHPRTFAVERLGVGDWPSLDTADGDVITRAMWQACEHRGSKLVDPVTFAFDVRPDRSWSAIVAAGLNQTGEPHVEIVDHRPGTAWLSSRLDELVEQHDAGPVAYAKNSGAESKATELEDLGVATHEVDAAEFGQACDEFLDAVRDERLRHGPQPGLQAAALGGRQRARGDSLIWSRRSSAVDISPLVAATLALFVSRTEVDAPFDPDDYRIQAI
jgi:hypothetical protein